MTLRTDFFQIGSKHNQEILELHPVNGVFFVESSIFKSDRDNVSRRIYATTEVESVVGLDAARAMVRFQVDDDLVYCDAMKLVTDNPEAVHEDLRKNHLQVPVLEVIKKKKQEILKLLHGFDPKTRG